MQAAPEWQPDRQLDEDRGRSAAHAAKLAVAASALAAVALTVLFDFGLAEGLQAFVVCMPVIAGIFVMGRQLARRMPSLSEANAGLTLVLLTMAAGAVYVFLRI
jgi:hypothetical protein